ncbi:MAG TPA: class I SAM-dependent methyltransferase [Methylomirabilota bacterium]|nr:class I SAM-dependent methyltransferase [Methylomirabilota bacterium]
MGRRRLFRRELLRTGLAESSRCLDVGTSTGANLRLLRDLGCRRVVGLEPSAAAIRFCESKGLGPVRLGDICGMPFPDATFDLVLATDVIEHVEDDRRALEEIHRVLVPGGYVLLTVPAFKSLWGLQDEVSLHKRRYGIADLLERVEDARLLRTHAFYFNYMLFGPIWCARRLMRILGSEVASEGQVNTPALNAVLSAVFTLDVWTAPYIRPPFGVSILVLAQKTRPGERRDG